MSQSYNILVGGYTGNYLCSRLRKYMKAQRYTRLLYNEPTYEAFMQRYTRVWRKIERDWIAYISEDYNCPEFRTLLFNPNPSNWSEFQLSKKVKDATITGSKDAGLNLDV